MTKERCDCSEESSKKSVKVVKSSEDSSQDQMTINGIFDLHTTIGQVTFIVIVAVIAVLIQTLPQDFFTKISGSNSQRHCNASLVHPVIYKYPPKPTYIIYNPLSERDGHLLHVKNVLGRLGFSNPKDLNVTDDWDLMWAHDYPFFKLPSLRQLKDHQRINHFPGSGFITNKVDLALTDSKFIPKAFRLPEDATKFVEYAKEFPEKEFVQKNNKHRHIYLKTIPEINMNDNETFIQEYMTNPFLVDGKKFDIGAYVVITSVDPLRIYLYRGDYLLRFCPEEYYPFDRNNLDKYVVGDDYTPTWEIKSLTDLHEKMGFGMRDCLDAYIRKQGKDPSVIWDQINESVVEVLQRKESLLINVLNRFQPRRNFFELMRFDFIIDENLRIFLLEANMSPNLSSAHFKPNKLLYEQVIYNTLRLVGVGSVIQRQSLKLGTTDEEAMMSAFKNIAIDADICASTTCEENNCDDTLCKFCRWCLTKDDLNILHTAYREHINRGDMQRIFPITKEQVSKETLSPKNVFMTEWFSKKCQSDHTWCN